MGKAERYCWRLVLFLCLVLLALLVTPRSKEKSRQFAKAYSEYRNAQEVSSWSH
ncbi:hypothetical protein [Geothermobacter hydrogeniphilus]|uniref:hypothetical protein n=1 Tax=Geothermobacter hydrogeniphilus TaxID=1969733 RepID=UPI0015566C17|nr:hypothetical protein [Geothermobacter hydrogeniphilus]